MKIAYTHNGPGHMDDFLSACLFLASGYDEVLRLSDKPNESIPAEAVAFDTGGGELDHHHLPGAGNGTCSVHLVAKYLGIQLVGSWPDYVGILDCGEDKKRSALNPAGAVSNPMIRWFLDQWSDEVIVGKYSPLYTTMVAIGTKIIRESAEHGAAVAEIDSRKRVFIGGFTPLHNVVDARGVRSFSATNEIGGREDVEFLIVDGREPNTVNLLKKGERPIPHCTNEIYRHPAGFMVVIPSHMINDDGHRQCRECGRMVNIFSDPPCCGQMCTV